MRSDYVNNNACLPCDQSVQAAAVLLIRPEFIHCDTRVYFPFSSRVMPPNGSQSPGFILREKSNAPEHVLRKTRNVDLHSGSCPLCSFFLFSISRMSDTIPVSGCSSGQGSDGSSVFRPPFQMPVWRHDQRACLRRPRSPSKSTQYCGLRDFQLGSHAVRCCLGVDLGSLFARGNTYT